MTCPSAETVTSYLSAAWGAERACIQNLLNGFIKWIDSADCSTKRMIPQGIPFTPTVILLTHMASPFNCTINRTVGIPAKRYCCHACYWGRAAQGVGGGATAKISSEKSFSSLETTGAGQER